VRTRLYIEHVAHTAGLSLTCPRSVTEYRHRLTVWSDGLRAPDRSRPGQNPLEKKFLK